MSTTWINLKKAALLGTEGEFDHQLGGAAILQQAGAKAFYQETGQQAKKLDHVPGRHYSEGDACSPRLSQLISLMLDGRNGEVLRETLELLGRKNLRLTAVLLPQLLDKASKLYALRPLVTPILGLVGRTLASEHKNWRYASQENLSWALASEDWRSNVSTARQGILFQLRLQDPAMALALIESSWRSEVSAATTWIVRQLVTNLSLQDEDFLELALDDRSITVRRKAAELLSHLPDSALTLRVTEYADEAIQFKDGWQLDMPDEMPNEWVRDGIILRNWQQKEKVKAAQLTDLMASVPLAIWQEKLGLDPAGILDSCAEHEWSDAFIKGFATAAERQKNYNWALALLKFDKLSSRSLKLVNILDEASFCELTDYLIELDEDAEQSVTKLFNRVAQKWPESISEKWLEYLPCFTEPLSSSSKNTILLKASFKQAARFCPASHFPELRTMLEHYKSHPVLALPSQEAFATLHLREQVYEAIED